jgi:hypothetical protein
MKRELSSGTGAPWSCYGLQGRDDPLEAGLDLAQVGGEAGLATGIGPGNEGQVDACLLAVDV